MLNMMFWEQMPNGTFEQLHDKIFKLSALVPIGQFIDLHGVVFKVTKITHMIAEDCFYVDIRREW